MTIRSFLPFLADSRNRPENDTVAARLGQQPASDADGMEHRAVSLRRDLMNARPRDLLTRAHDALRRQRPTFTTTLTHVPEGALEIAKIPASSRPTHAESARLAYTLFGDDDFARNQLAYQFISGITANGERVFFESDFPMLQSMVARHFGASCAHDMQRAFLSKTFTRETARRILGDESLATSLRKVGLLHTAAKRQWSDRFIVAMLGSAPPENRATEPKRLPASLATAFKEGYELEAERADALQPLLNRYLTDADMQALQPLAEDALGGDFLVSTRRGTRYLAEHPGLCAPLLAGLKKVSAALVKSPEFLAAAEASVILSAMRGQVQANRDTGDGHRACPPSQFARSIEAFAQTLQDAIEQAFLPRDDIETMSAETIAALPSWALLASVRQQVEAQPQDITLDAIAEEVFHRGSCRAGVQRLLTSVNALPAQAERRAALAAAPAALVATNLAAFAPAVRALVGAAKQVSSELLSGERSLFSGLCAQAYAKFGDADAGLSASSSRTDA